MTSLIFFKYSLKVDKSQEFNQIVCCINQIESIQILARETHSMRLYFFLPISVSIFKEISTIFYFGFGV